MSAKSLATMAVVALGVYLAMEQYRARAAAHR